MKKVIVFVVFFLGFLNKSQAQIQLQETSKNFIKEFGIGLHVTPFCVFTFKNNESYLLTSVSIDVSVCGPGSHHHVGYEIMTNSIELLNGIFINDTWDLYLYYSKNLASRDFLISVGIEKYFEGNLLNKIFFLDFGTEDFKYYSLSMGVIFELPLITLKHK